jgi:TonB family protein
LRNARSISLALLLLAGSLTAADEAARKLIQHPDPEYPAVAARMNLHGTVKLKVWISPDGSVRRMDYIGGHPLLAESALKAVHYWRFEPAPKETTEILDVKF